MAKRILIYTNHFFPENFKINEIADLLHNSGYEIHVVTCLPNYPEGKFYKGFGFFNIFQKSDSLYKISRLLLIPRGSGSKFMLILNYVSYFISTLIFTIYLIFFKKKYDLLLVHHTSPFLISVPPLIYKKFRNSKNILWDLDMWPNTLKASGVVKSNKILKILEVIIKKIYSRYDKILIGSKSFYNIATARVSDNKIEYFPNWAEEVFFNKINIKDENVLRIPNSFKILFAGNIGDSQDFENIYELIYLLKNYEVNFIFVGDGRKKKWFKDKVIKNKLSKKVTFIKNQPIHKVPLLYYHADALFLSLKDSEIFHKTVPAKLLSYMSAKKPIFGMLSGEGAELIKKSNGGITSDAGDFKSMAEKIISFMNISVNKRIDIGNNNYNYYNKNFSFSKRKKQILKIISNL